jgi:hypothetical protein
MSMHKTPDRDLAPRDEDTIKASIAELKRLAVAAMSADDAFAEAVGLAVANAADIAQEIRAAHITAADEQERLMRDLERGADAAAAYAARSGQSLDPANVMKDAAERTAKEAVASLGPDVLGGPVYGKDGALREVLPSLAQRAAEVGKALEGAVTRAQVRWRNGAGRPEDLGDRVDDERLRAILKTKPLGSVLALVEATLSDPAVSPKEWARVDVIARELAAAAVTKGPSGPQATGRKILAILDQAVEERMPASLTAGTEAIEVYRSLYRITIAPNASFQTAVEYRSMRTSDANLAHMLTSWSVDAGCWGRFLAPRPWRFPGWRPVKFVDRLTGATVREPKK